MLKRNQTIYLTSDREKGLELAKQCLHHSDKSVYFTNLPWIFGDKHGQVIPAWKLRKPKYKDILERAQREIEDIFRRLQEAHAGFRTEIGRVINTGEEYERVVEIRLDIVICVLSTTTPMLNARYG